MKYSRRGFLQVLGVGAVTAASINGPANASSEIQGGSTKQAYGLLNDSTKCIGCRSCEKACREFNKLPPPAADSEGKTIDPTELDANTFTYIEPKSIPKPGASSQEVKLFRRHMCNHCEHPSCASACPVGALTRSPLGPVYYRSERCIGCRYCINACPFSIPKYEWDTPKPFVRKCTMCQAKVTNGGPTSCSGACPSGAIKFGFRKDLLEEAHSRIDAEPDKYLSTVYGEDVVGGTGVLYLQSSMLPWEGFGFPMDLGNKAYPELTWAALNKVPGLALYVVIWTSIVYFITQRRIPEEIKNLKAEELH